jgi:hypothetical protein
VRASLTIVLLVIASALAACGDDSPSKTSTSQSRTGPSSARSDNVQTSHGRADGRSPSANKYPSVYVEAARVCAIGPPEKVAENLGVSSTKPRVLAQALAKGYLPRLRKAAFQGCLAALK